MQSYDLRHIPAKFSDDNNLSLYFVNIIYSTRCSVKEIKNLSRFGLAPHSTVYHALTESDMRGEKNAE